MIAVVDYGMGNLHSVRHALEAIGASVLVTQRGEDLRRADRIVLPGVGAFAECMKNLRSCGLLPALEEEVLEKGKPFLGICLGLQVLASEGEEQGRHPGLGWVPGVVRRFEFSDTRFRVPHIGWNSITPKQDSTLFQGLGSNPDFYFVHSYCLFPEDPTWIAASCDYGVQFSAAILHRNIFATQFHPEKSQRNGLRLLENFASWRP